MTDNQAWKIADTAYNLCEGCQKSIFPGIEIHSQIEQLLSVSKSVRDYFEIMLDRNDETREYYVFWFTT